MEVTGWIFTLILIVALGILLSQRILITGKEADNRELQTSDFKGLNRLRVPETILPRFPIRSNVSDIFIINSASKEQVPGVTTSDSPSFRQSNLPFQGESISSFESSARTLISVVNNTGIGRSGNKKARNKASKAKAIAELVAAAKHNGNFVSPSNGTDVASYPIALVKCENQTSCIHPKLQLERTFKVYYCKHVGHGVRFYFLVREGLLLHPNIILVSKPEVADVIVWLPESAPWHKSECAKQAYQNKTVVLDEGDGPQLFDAPNGRHEDWLLYFKRSYVRRSNGEFKGYMAYLDNRNVMPMTYTIAEAYVRPLFSTMSNRVLELVCTLRGGNHDPTRLRIRQWISEYAKARGLGKYIAGEVNSASRTIVSTGYLDNMYKARMIVTSNPSNWEGDFRLMEAISSGALIFVDKMFVPRWDPLIDGQHIVYYDNNNKTEIFDKLDFYRSQPDVSRRVAVSGYLHAMKHHRAANLIDYVFRTIHVKLAGGGPHETHPRNSPRYALLPQYSETGYDLRKQAYDFREMSKRRANSRGNKGK